MVALQISRCGGNLQPFSEESKSAFLLSPIFAKERPALIRKPQGKRGSSSPAAPPAPTARVDLDVLPVSDLLPACLVQLPAAPVAPALPPPPHATPSPAAPLPPPSPGQFFDVGARVRVVANTTTGIAPMHATGFLFCDSREYECSGEYTVKASGRDGRASWCRVSGEWLVPRRLDGIGAVFRGDEGRGGSAARELARAAALS